MRDPVADFFRGQPLAAQIFEKVAHVVEAMPDREVRVLKSQIGFYASGHPFAAAWMPSAYLRGGAPLVLTVFAHHFLPYAGWKKVVEPSPHHFTHHLELWKPEGVDEEVARLLRAALGDVSSASAVTARS